MGLSATEVKKLRREYFKLPNQTNRARLKDFAIRAMPSWLVVRLFETIVTKSAYKSKRESIGFFHSANLAYGAKQLRRSSHSLRVAFGLFGNELPKSYSRLIIETNFDISQDPSLRNSMSREILDATDNLPIEKTDASGWYQLSRGLFSLGHFRAGWKARENSIELSIIEGESESASTTAVMRAIQAHLERRSWEKTEHLLKNADQFMSQNQFIEIRDYLDLANHKYFLRSLKINPPRSDANQLLRALINEKNVSLIGPGSPSGSYGDEIDSADTVVRIKFVGSKFLPPHEFHGSRCDISHYNLIDPLYALDSSNNFLKDLRLILTSKAERFNQIQNVIILELDSSGPIYRTTSTSGIRVLFQLVRASPKKLKLFGFDFYSKIEQYNSNLRSFYQTRGPILGDQFMFGGSGVIPKFEIAQSFAAHDPVSNFCFAQNLHRAGLFEIEPYGASILTLTPYQYVERLEEMLGDW